MHATISGPLGPEHSVVVVSSVHDYRMPRRGSIQSVAAAFQRMGCRTVFLSVRFSMLSLLRNDPRAFLRDRANRFELCDGLQCYLWRTLWHPFALPGAHQVTAPLHALYAALPNQDIDAIFAEADVIVLESGLGAALISRVRRLNEGALLVYRGSDALDTIGAHPFLQETLERSAKDVDHFCLLAPAMARQFAFAEDRVFAVPQGIQPDDYMDIGPSPFGEGRNAVSVGSMLFDPHYFDVAAEAFPDIVFHVIGSGVRYCGRSNVQVYGEMAFRDMLPFVKHADIGIAPYRPAPTAAYLADSSLKLTQYAYLRVPAVCPHFAVGHRAHRFGYTPGRASEIVQATRSALSDTFQSDSHLPLSWDEVALRLLDPRAFPDTAIAPELFRA